MNSGNHSSSGVRQSLAHRLGEELRFFRGWLDKPLAVGAIMPTGEAACARMASVIDLKSGLPVLELGAGTGVVTRAALARGLPPERLYSVEYSPDFVAHLREHFPEVRVIEGDAFDLDRTLGEERNLTFDCVLSAVPLLSFPVEKRVAYLEDLLRRIPPGRPVVQITYCPRSPIPPGRGAYKVEHLDFVLRNFPPAQLWVYRRSAPA
jgi:phosphatidylethanolamine/phosphatidyl-N-methylethanolamine N-methyltransferase